MSIGMPARSGGDVLDQAAELLEGGISSAADTFGSVMDRVGDLHVGQALRGAAGRLADEADDLLEEVDAPDARDRAALGALVLLTIVALASILIIRQRRVIHRRGTAADRTEVRRAVDSKG
jgi:hypothetical protein